MLPGVSNLLSSSLPGKLRWFFWSLRTPNPTEVTIGQGQCADGVVGEDPVLGDEGRRQALRMLEEQAVMADAKAQNDIELAARFVQQISLGNRVSERLVAARPNFLVIFQSDLFFGNAMVFATSRGHVKAMTFENLA